VEERNLKHTSCTRSQYGKMDIYRAIDDINIQNDNEIVYNTDTIPAYIPVTEGEGIGKNGI
jgi:hypothetical protein